MRGGVGVFGALSGVGLFALLVAAPELSGQAVIVGQVLDAGSSEPVTGASVFLLRSNEERIRATDSDAEGRFLLPVALAGSYRVRVERLGYPAHTTDVLELSERDRLEIEIRLHPQAIGLDSLVVVGRRRESGREAFTRRREAVERGTFIDPIHIALAEPIVPTDLLRRVPDIEVTHRDQIRHIIPRRCLVVFVDDMRLPVMSTNPEARRVLGGNVDLNDFVSAYSVQAMEVYPTIADVPDEIRRGRRWPDIGRCGVIQVWTTTAW